jgi:hypothetical protein
MWTTTRATWLAAAALASVIGLGVGATGVAAAAAPSSSGHTVNMHIMVEPSAVAPGASFTDTFMVANVGDDGATDVRISVPFDSSAVQLLGVQFDQPGAWVTSVASNEFDAHLGDIGSHGQAVQVIASFAKLSGYMSSSTLPVTITYHYSDNGRGHSGTINTQLLPVEATALAQPASAATTVMAGGTLSVNSAIFSPNEAVTFWYNTPDGQALPLYIRNGQITIEKQHKDQLADGTTHEQNNGAFLNADAQGAIAAMFATNGLAPGVYTLVAHGLSSSATAVVAFQIQ